MSRPIQKDCSAEFIKNKASLKVRKKLLVENYCRSSDEEKDWVESGSSLDDISIIGEDPNDYCDMMPSKDLKVGDFILVKFLGGKRNSTTYRYLATIQEVYPDKELMVMFLKNISDNKGFTMKIDDVSNIKIRDVLGKLPVPEIKESEGRHKYVFEKPVDVYGL